MQHKTLIDGISSHDLNW